MIEYTLNLVQVAVAKLWAQAVIDHYKKISQPNPKVCAKDEFHILSNGMGAELAVADSYNVCADLKVYRRKGGHDLLIRDEKRGWLRYDVKQTDWLMGKLIIPVIYTQRNYLDVDRFFLVCGAMPNMRLFGWVDRENVINNAHLKPYRNTGGFSYFAEREELHEVFEHDLEAYRRKIW
jgi:hypothetical protein